MGDAQRRYKPARNIFSQPDSITFGGIVCFCLSAWVEENLYRGYLQPLLAREMSIWLAIVVQAAIFSVAHFGYSSHLLDFGSVFVTGLILGWLRGRESSLVAPFVAHGLFWMMGAFMVIPS